MAGQLRASTIATVTRTLVAAALVALAATLAAGCGSGGDTSAPATETTAATSPGGCKEVELPPARDDGGATPPSQALDPAQPVRLDFVTNCGSFTVTLDVKGAPHTSASLVSLARAGFYDDTVFHRIVPGFVIQGGDPTQSGAGGPGYQTVDPPPTNASYTKGVVAMAKTADEPAGTAGSQFFVVTGDDVSLPPDYAIVGKVTAGLDVVERIGRLGDTNEQPTEPVVVSHVVVDAGP
jgi:peptidyl-prolyl cis-trans isomerase B (cyclophilin B)